MSELRTDETGMVDPRVCPGFHPDGGYTLRPEDQHDTNHYWYGPSCFKCGITHDQLRDAFRDWRYETVIVRLTEALERLAGDGQRIRGVLTVDSEGRNLWSEIEDSPPNAGGSA